MDLQESKNALRTAVEAVFPVMRRIGRHLFDHPELSGEERESTRFLAEEMEKLGFTVQRPYCGIETALRADFKNGDGPTVAFLAEYDALPGYGPGKDAPAHACGHNWIAATCCGAAAALARCPEAFRGTVSVIGAPAEETYGGKVELLRAHGYDGVDAAVQIHLGERTTMDGAFLALDAMEFTFHGKAAHAAGQPHLGINALDAVMLTFAGINALRQHVTPDVRMHGIVTDGGRACNVVPDLGRCRFYLRAAKRAYLDELRERVINVARGAALMTGATMEWRRYENPFDELLHRPRMIAALRANLEANGVTEFTTRAGGEAFGSSDVGNVSQACPTVYAELSAGLAPGVAPHMEGFLEGVVGERADRTMRVAAAAMGMTALDVFSDPAFYLAPAEEQ